LQNFNLWSATQINIKKINNNNGVQNNNKNNDNAINLIVLFLNKDHNKEDTNTPAQTLGAEDTFDCTLALC
jgi:hypothetical protein